MTIINTNFLKIFTFSIVLVHFCNCQIELNLTSVAITDSTLNINNTTNGNIDTTTTSYNIEDIEDVEQLFGLINTTNTVYNEPLSTTLPNDDDSTTFEDIENLLSEDIETTIADIETSTTQLPKLLFEDTNSKEVTTEHLNKFTELRDFTNTIPITKTINIDEFTQKSLEDILPINKEELTEKESGKSFDTTETYSTLQNIPDNDEVKDSIKKEEEITTTSNSITISEELNTQTTITPTLVSSDTSQSQISFSGTTNAKSSTDSLSTLTTVSFPSTNSDDLKTKFVLQNAEETTTNNMKDHLTTEYLNTDTTHSTIMEEGEGNLTTSQVEITTDLLANTIDGEGDNNAPVTEDNLGENKLTVINLENNGKLYLEEELVNANKTDSYVTTEDLNETKISTTETGEVLESSTLQPQNSSETTTIIEEDFINSIKEENSDKMLRKIIQVEVEKKVQEDVTTELENLTSETTNSPETTTVVEEGFTNVIKEEISDKMLTTITEEEVKTELESLTSETTNSPETTTIVQKDFGNVIKEEIPDKMLTTITQEEVTTELDSLTSETTNSPETSTIVQKDFGNVIKEEIPDKMLTTITQEEVTTELENLTPETTNSPRATTVVDEEDFIKVIDEEILEKMLTTIIDEDDTTELESLTSETTNSPQTTTTFVQEDFINVIKEQIPDQMLTTITKEEVATELESLTSETTNSPQTTTVTQEEVTTEFELITELNALKESIVKEFDNKDEVTARDELPTTYVIEESTTQENEIEDTNALSKVEFVSENENEKLAKEYFRTEGPVTVTTSMEIVDATRLLLQTEIVPIAINDKIQKEASLTTIIPNVFATQTTDSEEITSTDKSISMEEDSITNTELNKNQLEFDSNFLEIVTENDIKESDYEAATISHVDQTFFEPNNNYVDFNIEETTNTNLPRSLKTLTTENIVTAFITEINEDLRIDLLNNIDEEATTIIDNFNIDTMTMAPTFDLEEKYVPFTRKLVPLVEQNILQVNLNVMESTTKADSEPSIEENVSIYEEEETEEGIYKKILDILATERNDFQITFPIQPDSNVDHLLENQTDRNEMNANNNSSEENGSINDDFEIDDDFIENLDMYQYVIDADTDDDDIDGDLKNGTDSNEVKFDSNESIFIAKRFDINADYSLWINFTCSIYLNGSRFKLNSNATVRSVKDSKDILVSVTWKSLRNRSVQFNNISFNVVPNRETFNIDLIFVEVKSNGFILSGTSKNLSLEPTKLGNVLELNDYKIHLNNVTVEFNKLSLLCTHTKQNDTNYPTEKLFLAQNMLLVEIIGISAGCLILLIVLFVYIYKRYRSNVLKITLD